MPWEERLKSLFPMIHIYDLNWALNTWELREPATQIWHIGWGPPIVFYLIYQNRFKLQPGCICACVNSWDGPWLLFVFFVFLCTDITKGEPFVKRIHCGPQLALLRTHLKLTGQRGFVLKTKVWSYQCFNSFLLRKEVVFALFLGSSRYMRSSDKSKSTESDRV